MIWQMIEDWFRGILTDGILSNLSGLFDSVNTEVGEIATQVGTTPAGWNAGIFNMIRSLSENVIVPIAGVIITFVMCYELIQLVIEKNNLHDLDTWIFFKWIFKTFVAVLLVTNTWNIVMGVFDITQSVVNDSAGVIISDTSIDIATVITDIEAKLDAMSVGGLLGLWFQSLFVGLTMKALSILLQKSNFVVLHQLVHQCHPFFQITHRQHICHIFDMAVHLAGFHKTVIQSIFRCLGCVSYFPIFQQMQIIRQHPETQHFILP